MTQVAVLVPGIMGSVLELNGKLIWPGPMSSLVFSYKLMPELMSDGLKATDCIRSYLISSQYITLINDLEKCGFSETAGTLVIAAYDWRRDNAKSAKTLADILEQVRIRQGVSCEISLIAHSMGGLVSRYYLESGEFSTHPALGNVKRLITLATPHQGAALALTMALGQEKQLFLSKEQVLEVCSDERFPAAYQLLPPPGEPFVVTGGPTEQFLPMDIYDSSIATALNLVPKNLAAAKTFHSKLSLGKRPPGVRYFCFAGTRQKTATYVRLQKRTTGFLAVKVEQEDGGDGTVPSWSSFFSRVERYFCGGEHGTIYQNNDLRRILGTILSREGVLAGIPDETQLAIRDKVVEPADEVHASISFPGKLEDFSGVITVERVQIDPTTEATTIVTPPVSAFPIAYKGVGVESLSIKFPAPDKRGMYRVAVRNSVEAAPSAIDYLIVQEPTIVP